MSGTQGCDSTGRWTALCSGQVTPQVEACNGLDDNCDGTPDNIPRTGNNEHLSTAAVQAKNAGCVGDGVVDWFQCANGAHLFCRDQGCRTAGYGLLERTDSDVDVACLSTDAPLIVTASDLAPFGTCPVTSSPAPGDKWECAKTVRSYCRAAGYTSGFGPVAMPSPNQLAVICLRSGHAIEMATTYEALRQVHGGCTDASIVRTTSIFCVGAAHRYCRGKGFVAGFGPVADADGVSPVVVCLDD